MFSHLLKDEKITTQKSQLSGCGGQRGLKRCSNPIQGPHFKINTGKISLTTCPWGHNQLAAKSKTPGSKCNQLSALSTLTCRHGSEPTAALSAGRQPPPEPCPLSPTDVLSRALLTETPLEDCCLLLVHAACKHSALTASRQDG